MSILATKSYINASCKPRTAEVRHELLMPKTPKVLGDHVGKFTNMISVTVGKGAQREQKIYNFPKREAMLMAMSIRVRLTGSNFRCLGSC